MNYFDLVLLRQGFRVNAFCPDANLSQILRAEVNTTLFGEDFESRGACCEWLEVVDASTGDPIGVALMDFYGGMSDCIDALEADNVRWTNGWTGLVGDSVSVNACEPEKPISKANGRAVILFTVMSDWRIQSGPYLPAHFFKGSRGTSMFLVPDVRCVEGPPVPELAAS